MRIVEANKTLQASHSILNMIAKKRLSAGDKIPAEIEMSEILGVSTVTVQRAMALLVKKNIIERSRGRGSFVKDDFFDKQLIGTISFLLISPRISHHYDAIIFDSRKAAVRRKYELRLVAAGNSPDADAVAQISKTNGIIMTGKVTQAWVDFVESMNIPFVILGNHNLKGDLTMVRADYRSAGMLLAEKLRGRGCERIGLINGARSYLPCVEIYDGLKEALSCGKVSFDDKDALWCSIENRYGEISDFMSSRKKGFDGLIVEGGCLEFLHNFFYEHAGDIPHPILGVFSKPMLAGDRFSKYEVVDFKENLGDRGVDALFAVMGTEGAPRTHLIETIAI